MGGVHGERVTERTVALGFVTGGGRRAGEGAGGNYRIPLTGAIPRCAYRFAIVTVLLLGSLGLGEPHADIVSGLRIQEATTSDRQRDSDATAPPALRSCGLTCPGVIFGSSAAGHVSSEHVVASDESHSQIGLTYPILPNGPVRHISGGHRHKYADMNP